jgi:Zn-dependent protease
VPGFDLAERVMWLIPLVLSLTVHEFAHAWSAWRLGDDTASRMGRMTLNPIAHIDPIGTILLPLFSPIPFGWARPVPVNPTRFRRGVHMSTGMALTASAGPLSNVALAILAAIGYGVLLRFSPETVAPGSPASSLLRVSIAMNVNLALFNLIPVPPLDGSRVVDGLLPYQLRPQWDRVLGFAPYLLVAVFLFGGRLIAGPSRFVIGLLGQLVRAVVGA